MNTELEPIASNLSQPDSPPRASRRRVAVVASVVLLVASGLVAGILPRLKAQSQRDAASQEVVVKSVNVTNVARVKSNLQLLLPGDVRAFEALHAARARLTIACASRTMDSRCAGSLKLSA